MPSPYPQTYETGAFMPPKDRKPQKPKSQRDRQPKRGGKGWLMLGLGEEETGMAPGKAIHFAQELCPDVEVPSVEEVRSAHPEELFVGTTANGESVSLRSLVAGEDPEPEPGSE
jgi:hypothetical protein